MTISKIGAVLCVLGGFAYAENYTGKLVTATCQPSAPAKADSQANACDPTHDTTSFAIQTADGKVIKLDAGGNSKVTTTINTQGLPADKQVTVTGTMDGQMLKVETISFGQQKR